MASRSRVLFAALTLPFPPTNGHRLRTWSLLRALAADGYSVTLVSLAEPDELNGDIRQLSEVCTAVELVRAPRRSSSPKELLARLRAIPSPAPYAASRLYSQTFRTAAERHLAQEPFDFVLCDGIYNVQNLPQDPRVPVLLNKDDVAHVIMDRYFQLQRNPAKKLYARLEAWKVRRWERTACSRMKAVLTCSHVDRSILQRLCPRVPMHVIPNVVDTEHYAPMGTPEPRTVLFQGGMDWHPNRDAVEFFATVILPKLRELVPRATFRIAGRSPSAVFRRKFGENSGLEFTGAVPDMRTEIAKATLCVVPLRIGSGTRLKILEAGAMGKAVVSTRLGAEGLEFTDGQDIVLADEPRDFAEAIAALLADASRREQIGAAARCRVESAYSLPVLCGAVRAALCQLCDPVPPRPRSYTTPSRPLDVPS